MAKLIAGRNGGMIRIAEKGESANPKGRPKSRFKELLTALNLEHLKDFEISIADSKQLIRSLFILSREELELLRTNPKTPAIVINHITALYKDIRNGEIKTATGLINLEFPKEEKKSEGNTTNNIIINATELTNEALRMINVTPQKKVEEKKDIDKLI